MNLLKQLREHIKSMRDDVAEAILDPHDDPVSDLAGRADELGRDIIAAIAQGDVPIADAREVCEAMHAVTVAIDAAYEALR